MKLDGICGGKAEYHLKDDFFFVGDSVGGEVGWEAEWGRLRASTKTCHLIRSLHKNAIPLFPPLEKLVYSMGQMWETMDVELPTTRITHCTRITQGCAYDTVFLQSDAVQPRVGRPNSNCIRQ